MSPEENAAKTEIKLDLPLQGKFGLVGREDEMAGLERAFQRAPTVLLTGASGVGKTELACGFARRLVDKKDRQGGVFYTAFEYGAGLCRLLHEMGTTLQGIRFARLSLDEQRRRLVEYLKNNPCLLIWDNFEDAFQHLDAGETQELTGFLTDVAGGPTYVLVTGRGVEWTAEGGIEYEHEELQGLVEAEADKLAGLILGGAGVVTRGPGTEYRELLLLLHGNPRSMRLALPHLKKRTPSELIHSLQGIRGPAPGEPEDSTIALECCFSYLSPRTRAHLPFLAFFQQRVLLDVLTFMTQGEVYKSVTGEQVGWGACRAFLREARDYGFLDDISPSVYQISSPVSRFLRGQLVRRLTSSQIGDLEQEFVRVYSDLGDYFLENLSSLEGSESTVTGVLAEEANLLQAVHLAEKGNRWEQAQLILQPLGQVYKMQDRILELRRIRKLLLSDIGLNPQEAEQRGAIDLWLYLQGTEINDTIERQEHDEAESICSTVLGYLESLADSAFRPRIAWIFHQRGLIAHARDRLERAEEWYTEALKINESLGFEAECADSYHQLGLIAQSRGNYEEAEGWHQKALGIREGLEDGGELASECYQLALVAEARHQLEDSLEWYHRARTAYEGAGDQASVAAVCHRLGLIDQSRYHYEEAAGWYQRALLIYEELEDQDSGVNDCYQLGVISLLRYEYEEAGRWLHQASQAYERLGNEKATASSYHQLGLMAHAQQQYEEAEEWYQRALQVFVRLDEDVVSASTWGQLGLLAEQQGNYPHAVWYVAHTYEIAVSHQLNLLTQAKSHLSSLRSKMGSDNFLKAWQQISDSDILSNLD